MHQLKNYHKYFYKCLLHVVKVSSHLEKQDTSFYICNYYDPEISAPAKNSMILTAPYSEVSLAMTNLFFIRVTPIYREHVQKKFECK